MTEKSEGLNDHCMLFILIPIGPYMNCYVYSISKFMLAICKIIYIIEKSEVVEHAFDFVGHVSDRNEKHIVIFIFIVKSSLSWISF